MMREESLSTRTESITLLKVRDFARIYYLLLEKVLVAMNEIVGHVNNVVGRAEDL